ncbi:MAG: TrkH family potassium uptake protein [Bacteroidetes bacterium]|uniref:TrkH family potassium uptake protein n=1 Tax=Candidatus Gallipaludibacter merdavium TaxID=2840839 RepID=A0A9D9HU23_9BACT|nr:TrkH family potassium uptake protein [Candidatus Gallipaludibacter merdavium]
MTRTFNFKIVWFTLGALLVLEAVFMLLSSGVAFLYEESDALPILYAALITMGFAGLGILLGRKTEKRLGKREGYIIVALVWIVFSLFGMLPFYLSGTIPTITDAFFETMSGFTTTGSSILTDVETLSHGLHFWRSLTHWLGGMGIIVLSLAILPFFGIGGMSLYTAEATGATYEKLRPKIRDTAKLLWGIYVLLTAVEALCLSLLGMDVFEAICHSFSTLATGGYSTRNAGMAAFSPAIQYVVTIFMFLAGINFSMLYFLFKGKFNRLKEDEELHWYVGAVVVLTVVMTLALLFLDKSYPSNDVEKAFRDSVFVVVTLMTTTGFSGVDYTLWHPLLLCIAIFLLFTGASAGSTAGGMKWSRLAFMFKNVRCEFMRLIHPNAIIPVRMNGKVVNSSVANGIVAFLFVYMVTVLLGTIVFTFFGLPLSEAFGAAATSIGNVGPGLGLSGPAGNFALMPVPVKWIMSFFMLLGRLELFTVLLIFTPSFWGK